LGVPLRQDNSQPEIGEQSVNPLSGDILARLAMEVNDYCVSREPTTGAGKGGKALKKPLTGGRGSV
jgi:hypothetical protein